MEVASLESACFGLKLNIYSRSVDDIYCSLTGKDGADMSRRFEVLPRRTLTIPERCLYLDTLSHW